MIKIIDIFTNFYSKMFGLNQIFSKLSYLPRYLRSMFKCKNLRKIEILGDVEIICPVVLIITLVCSYIVVYFLPLII